MKNKNNWFLFGLVSVVNVVTKMMWIRIYRLGLLGRDFTKEIKYELENSDFLKK